MSDTVHALSARFAQRLRLVCDRAGFGEPRLARASQLAAQMGVDISIASVLLSGERMPSWDQLSQICALFQQEPGYFLDEVPGAGLKQLISAQPLEDGDSGLIRLPDIRRTVQPDSSESYNYLRASSDLGFGVRRGDTLINLSFNKSSSFACGQSHYLLHGDRGFELRYFTSKTGKGMLYADSQVNDAPPMIFPSSLERANLIGLSRVKCLVRPQLDQLHS
jgi:transcriptional regulator with XRE-family HTH domain